MFLFQGPFGNILHTGDCRFTEEVVRSVRGALGRSPQHGWGEEGGTGHAAGSATAGPSEAAPGGDGDGDGCDEAGSGGGERLDLIYVDCTFADLPLDFPTREEAVRQAEQLVRSWAANTAAGPAASRPPRVYLAADMLGQEPLLTLAGSLGGQPVYVPPPERHREYGFDNADVLRERRDALAALQHHPDLAGRLALSDDPACRFHLCGVRDFAQRGTGGRAGRADSGGGRGAGGSLCRTGSGAGLAAGAMLAPTARLSSSLGEAGAPGAALPDPDGGAAAASAAVAAPAGRGDGAAGGPGPCLYVRASVQVFAQQVRAQYRQDQLLAVRAAHPPPTAAMQERAVHYVLFSQHSSRGELVAALEALRPRAACPINQEQVMSAVVAERAGTERLADVEADIKLRLAWAEAEAPAAEAAAVPATGAGPPRRAARRAVVDPDSWDWDEDEEEEETGEEEHAGGGDGQVLQQPRAEQAQGQGAQQLLPRPQPAPAQATRTGAMVVDAVATVTYEGSSAAAGPHGLAPAGGGQALAKPPPLLPPAPHAGALGGVSDGGGLRDPSALERRCQLLLRLGFPIRLDGRSSSAVGGSGSASGPGGGGSVSVIAAAYADALRAAIASAEVGADEARRQQQREEMGWQAACSGGSGDGGASTVGGGGGGGGTWRRCATLTCMSSAATARLRAQGCHCCCGDMTRAPAPQQVVLAAQQATRNPPPRVATLSGLLRLAHGAPAGSGRAAAAAAAAATAAAGGTAAGEQGDNRATPGTGAGSGSGAHSSCRAPIQEPPDDQPKATAAVPVAVLRSPLRQIQQPPSSPAADGPKPKPQQGHTQQPTPAAIDATAATGTPPRHSRHNTGPLSTAAAPQASCLLALIMGSPASPRPQPPPRSPQHQHGTTPPHGSRGRSLVAPSPRHPCSAGRLTPPQPQPQSRANPRGLSASAGSSGGGGSGGEAGGQRARRTRLSGSIGLFTNTTPDSPQPGSEGQHPWRQSPATLPLQGICSPGPQHHALPEPSACGSERGDAGRRVADLPGAPAAAADKQGQATPRPVEGLAPVAGKRAVPSPPRRGQEQEQGHSSIRSRKRPRLAPYVSQSGGTVTGAAATAAVAVAAATYVAPSKSCYLSALLASSSDEDE
ncbi:hypothetical protein HYH02_012894 [Chlamydomonas schloesseri]|uniref:DNA repair metallo-beta-lactamase domain-containing protein n=1 Tax=Chlamydomonas schloesseri TaxID=2026947 RepID=A0A835W1L3_9CHLO|nr:hypothetical protein HYH02_012894 [Chlamydomonas schloesseri]|eukprot:KAG2432761.1 hypothetical protein HYH02_012894 [Chlamydomonas schloesseri]